MRTQLVDGLFADLLQVVRFLRVYMVLIVAYKPCLLLYFQVTVSHYRGNYASDEYSQSERPSS